MKTLYLVRHAKAISRERPGPDFERRLRKRGKQDAQRLARHLKHHGPLPDLILSSPANRAIETARIFAEVCGYATDTIRTHAALYDQSEAAEEATLLPLIRATENAHQALMIVGHDPLLTAFTHVLHPDFTAWLPTCGVVCTDFQVEAWADVAPGHGTVRFFFTPKSIVPPPLPSEMDKPVRFALPEAFARDDFIRDLSDQYVIKQEKTATKRCVYYDTFDWRLYQRSLMLCHTATGLCLQAFPEHTTLASTPIAGPPVFVSDLPDGVVHERLASIIEVRALLKLFAMQSRCTCVRLLNRDEKTVVRLLFEDHAMVELPGAPRLAARLWLRPVRGYDKQASRVARWLTARGFTVVHDSPYLQGLAAVQKPPGEYSSKLRVQLHPAMRADEATKIILRSLFQVMRQNEAGIIDDVDTEFLHDFRVAVRRTRSALGQIKQVFPAPVTARFQKDFAYLTSITNPLRDLDVYLLHKADYQAMLPAPLRPDIEPLFAYIQRERSKALHTLKRRLRSKTYADIIRRWEAFLEQRPEENPAAAKATRPIRQVARQRLEKKCRSVVRLGQSLPADADARQLHALRIECKKLRYLLEFFASLFPDMAALIKHLKQVQDTLGRFHDLCVQEESLQDFATRLGASNRQAAQTLSAVDALIRVLDGEKQVVRHAFPEIFTAFVTWLSAAHRNEC